MTQRYLSEEERLARKLFGFLISFFVLLVIAGVVFYVASTPPDKPVVVKPGRTPQKAVKESVDSFRDLIAQVRFRGWSLEKRKEEAGKLLDRAPNDGLRRDVEKLIQELDREGREEERYKKLIAFQSLKGQLVLLYKKNEFNRADTLMKDFLKEAEGFQTIIAQVEEEKRRSQQVRLRTFQRNRLQAETLINQGEVTAVEEVQKATLAFVPPKYREEVTQWSVRARQVRFGGQSGTDVAQNNQGNVEPVPSNPPDMQPNPPNATDVAGQPNPPGKTPGTTDNGGNQNPDVPDVPEEGGSFFDEPGTLQGVMTVAAVSSSTAFTVQDKNQQVVIAPLKTKLFEDVLIAEDQFSEWLPKGASVWVLGIPKVSTVNIQNLGPTVVKRVTQLGFVFLADHFFPDAAWTDQQVPGRKWCLGQVAMSYPILRIAINDHTFYVEDRNVLMVKRKAVNVLPAQLEGRKVWVRGALENGTIKASVVYVLADKMLAQPAYLANCK